MAKSIPVRKEDYEGLHFSRWLLLLFAASDAAGLGPLSRRRLHALLFVSFASSRFYDIAPLRYRARRTEQGPYYRMAHFALGALIMSGLIEIRQFKAYPARNELQFEGESRLRRQGLLVVRKLRQTSFGERLYQFLLELCLAASRTEESKLDGALLQDLTYQTASERGEPTVGTDDEQTPTLVGLQTIDRYLNDLATSRRRDALAAYQRLLATRAAA
ncbi:MAG: hypothetical protein AMXMBFR59_31340 [Rhodanobacteraceae bacterium]